MTQQRERVCKYCNRKFTPKRSNAKFHSDSCRVLYWNAQKKKREQHVMLSLRAALSFCVNRHPDLLDEVNRRLEAARTEKIK